MASPYTKKEEKKFTVFASGLTGLACGYLFTKIIDPALTHLFNDAAILKNPIYGADFLIFLIALIVSMIGGYSFREYIPNAKNNHNDEESAP